MSTINFPISPVVGQIYTFQGKSWQFNGIGFEALPATVTATLQCFPIACGDETTGVTVGPAKVTFRIPYGFALVEVRASCNSTSDDPLVVDIKKGGVSILSTKLTIDQFSKTSVTSTVPAVISDASFGGDAEITIDIVATATFDPVAGLKVYLIGVKV